MRPLLLKGHERPLTQLKFNPEGDLLFTTAKDTRPTVWWASTGERLGTYDGHTGAVWSCDVFWDSTRLLTGSADNTARLWDVQTGRELFRWSLRSSVRSVGVAPGCRLMHLANSKLLGQESCIHLFRLKSDGNWQEQETEPFLVLRGHTATITGVVWYNTAEYMLSVSEDGTVRKWDVETGKEVDRARRHKKAITDIKFSKDHQMFLTGSADGTAVLWDTHAMQEIRSFVLDRPLNAVDLSPLMPHAVVGGGQEASQVTTTAGKAGKFAATFLHLIYGEEIFSVKGHFGPINCLSFTPDGRGFASGGEDGYVRLHHFDEEYYRRSSEI
jgi:translation initiation factor 3 subunit I